MSLAKVVLFRYRTARSPRSSRREDTKIAQGKRSAALGQHPKHIFAPRRVRGDGFHHLPGAPKRNVDDTAQRIVSYRALVSRVVDAFGDEVKASRWLSLPNRDLAHFSCWYRAALKGHGFSRAARSGTDRADTLQIRPGSWFTDFGPFAKACRREACLGL